MELVKIAQITQEHRVIGSNVFQLYALSFNILTQMGYVLNVNNMRGHKVMVSSVDQIHVPIVSFSELMDNVRIVQHIICCFLEVRYVRNRNVPKGRNY